MKKLTKILYLLVGLKKAFPCSLILFGFLIGQAVIFFVLILGGYGALGTFFALFVFALATVIMLLMMEILLYAWGALLRISSKRKQKEKIKYESSHRYEPKQTSKSIQDLAQESTSDKNIVIEDDGEIGEIDHR